MMEVVKTVCLDEEIVKALNDWRREQWELPSFSKAVRYFLRVGIDTLFGKVGD